MGTSGKHKEVTPPIQEDEASRNKTNARFSVSPVALGGRPNNLGLQQQQSSVDEQRG